MSGELTTPIYKINNRIHNIRKQYAAGRVLRRLRRLTVNPKTTKGKSGCRSHHLRLFSVFTVRIYRKSMKRTFWRTKLIKQNSSVKEEVDEFR